MFYKYETTASNLVVEIALSTEDRNLLNRFLREYYIADGNGSVYVVPDIELSRMVQGTESVPPTEIAESLQRANFTIAEVVLDEKPRLLGVENFRVVTDYARIAYLLQNGALKEYKQ